MPLTNDLISQFVKVTKDKTAGKSETVVYGTVQESKAPNGLNYVKIDGSNLLTPISSTTVVSANDRVTIMIKNHSAVVTGNLTSPSARSKDTISVLALDAQAARINDLEAANVTISGKVTANEGEIRNLKSDRVTASEVDAKYATIVDLNAQKGRIDTLESTYISSTVVAATYATIASLNTEKGRIDILETEKLSAADIEGKYANIDFSNISKATMGQFYANSGLIQNVVVGDSTITGKLVGVTISGDLIEGNTVKAEKLVIKGTDGLYYKLNTDGVTTEAQQTNQNSLDGSVIKAKSVTASKVNVTDLVAFGATIGGFNITDSALYSGVKSAANNTTRGIYLGKDAQFAIGDGTSYIKYYKDSNGNYKLDISADSINLTSGTNDQYGLKIANANDSSGSLGSGTTKPALVIGTPSAYHIEMDNNEIMAKSNATTSSHLFLNMEGGNVSVNNNANRAFMFQEGALYAKNSSFNNGEYLGILDAINDTGNTTLGYGGYLKKIGGTNVYGNSISLVSNGNVDVEASWIKCRSITPSDNATYALGTYGEKGWSNIYLGKGDGKTNALHIISGSSTYTLCGVNSSGQYIFGNNAAVMYYQVKNVSETATGNAFKVTSGNNTAANNTSSVWFFGAADATSRYIGSYLAYNRTYSSTANMVVTGNGIFGRSTSSSQRYKKDISIANIDDLRGLYDLPVKKFKYKEDYIAADDELYDKPLYGFIVEDLENVLPCAVQHEKDTDGTVRPEMWNSNVIVPSLLKLIQDLNTRLKTLEEKEN